MSTRPGKPADSSFGALVAALILALTLILPVSSLAGQMKPFDGPTPPLKLKDTSGKTHQLSDYKGKVVLVQFWATYCTPCRKEMPSMNRLLNKLDGQLVILAVNMGETRPEVEAFMKEVGVEFPVLLDERGKAIEAWKVFAAPSNFVIDGQGKIRYTLFGGVDWDAPAMVAFLKKLAAE